MSRRDRPPHPDVLTPREWEVLALLREGLSDEAIGERLGVSIHGAKYHVREILSKLGVSSRQEAAAWQPKERAPAARWLALPMAARIGAALVIVAAVAGLGVLAWGVLRTEGGEGDGLQKLDLPTPAASPAFTRDQMLVLAGLATPDDTRAISLAWTTLGDAMEASAMEGLEIAGADMGSPVWLVRADAVYDPCELHECGPPLPPDQPSRTRTVGCHALFLIFPDRERYYTGLTEDAEDGNCPSNSELTHELSLLIAGRATARTFDPESGPPAPIAERMTLGEALFALDDRGAGSIGPIFPQANDTPVWLVTLRGRFLKGELEQSDSTTPQPTTVVSCADRLVILDVRSHGALYQTQARADACD